VTSFTFGMFLGHRMFRFKIKIEISSFCENFFLDFFVEWNHNTKNGLLLKYIWTLMMWIKLNLLSFYISSSQVGSHAQKVPTRYETSHSLHWKDINIFMLGFAMHIFILNNAPKASCFLKIKGFLMIFHLWNK